MPKIPISVCIIAKNEEKHIEECLKRIKPYGFEIIVTDTGSMDRTKELAAPYADKVLDFEWNDDFAAARNFCARHASNNWILSLDCDEYVNRIDIGELRIFMQKYPRHAGVMQLKSLMYDGDGKQTYETDEVTRFYNRNYYTYDFPIHEQVCTADPAKRTEPMQCFLLPMEVLHYGYALTPGEMQAKQKRNLDMLEKRLASNPDDPYTWFQIGQSELALDHTGKAVACYEKGLSYQPPAEYVYVQAMVIALAKSYVKLGREKDALALMDSYSSSCRTAKFVYAYAGVLLDSGNVIKALLMYVKTTTLPDVDTLGANLMCCYQRIIDIHKGMGNHEMAELFAAKLNACIHEKERVTNSR